MIGRITSYTLRHRAIVLAVLVLFILAGINAFQRLPVEAFPDVSNMSVQVITLFPGHAAEEVERLVTIPIENQMNSVPKLVSLRSISLFGLSQVTLVFEDGADPDYVRNQVNQYLSVVTLPPGAQASLSPNATPIGEIYRYTLKAPQGYSAEELKALEDWVVERKLRTVPGVVDVVGFGGPTKQYQVQVDPLKLKSYNLSLQQVFTALANGNRNAGGSYVEHGSEMYVVRGLGFVRDTADIGAIAVDSRGGTPIRISDIGTVTIGHAVRLGRVGMLFKTPGGVSDDDDAVQGIVIMRRGENPRDVLDGIHAKVQEINAHYLPPGIRMVSHYDRTELIHRTLHTVRQNMIEGIALVVLVLVLFLGLGNYRTALVVALAVPVSLLGAYLLLDLRGIPANLISMGAIDFGIIVDSAVVIAENLIRILHERKDKLAIPPGRDCAGRPRDGPAHPLLQGHPPDRLHSRLHLAARRGAHLPAHGPDADLCPGDRHDLRRVRRAPAAQLRRPARDAGGRLVDRAQTHPALPPGVELRHEPPQARLRRHRRSARLRRPGLLLPRLRVPAQAGRGRPLGPHLHAQVHFALRGRQDRPAMSATASPRFRRPRTSSASLAARMTAPTSTASMSASST